jgi:hypothetical protein
VTARYPNATAATNPELAQLARTLACSGWSVIEQLQVVLDLAPRWGQDLAGLAGEVAVIAQTTHPASRIRRRP